MKTFVNSFVVLAVAVALAAASPLPEDTPAAVVEVAVPEVVAPVDAAAAVESPAVMATKQNIFTDGITAIQNFVANIPTPTFSNPFAAPNATANGEPATGNTPANPNPLEAWGNALVPVRDAFAPITTFFAQPFVAVQNAFNPTTTEATKTEAATPAAAATAA